MVKDTLDKELRPNLAQFSSRLTISFNGRMHSYSRANVHWK